MSGSAIRMTFDDKELVHFVTSVKKSEKRILRRAYAAAVRPIVNEARKQYRRSLGSTLAKAVRGGAWKKGGGASAYIRSPLDGREKTENYKLLFFEGGTVNRFARRRNGKAMRKKASRGRIKALRHFATAIAAKQAQGITAFETTLRDWIKAHS